MIGPYRKVGKAPKDTYKPSNEEELPEDFRSGAFPFLD